MSSPDHRCYRTMNVLTLESTDEHWLKSSLLTTANKYLQRTDYVLETALRDSQGKCPHARLQEPLVSSGKDRPLYILL